MVTSFLSIYRHSHSKHYEFIPSIRDNDTLIQNDVNLTGYEGGKEIMHGKHNNGNHPGQSHNKNIKQKGNSGGLVEIDGFDISKIPEHLRVPDSIWAGNNRTKPTLLKIGDITVPELRRRLMLKRQQVLNKNKYYVQQKVTYLVIHF